MFGHSLTLNQNVTTNQPLANRFVGLGFVPILAPVHSEMIFEAFGVKEVHFLKNLPCPIDTRVRHDSLAVKVIIHDLENEEFESLATDRFFLNVVKPSTKVQILRTLGERFNLRSEMFEPVMHPFTYRSASAKWGHGVMLEPLSALCAWTEVGNFVHVKGKVWIGHHTKLENWVTINPGSTISSESIIGAGTTVGAGARVLDGIKIGKGSFIGAGSVVTRDIPDGVIAYGSPCKVVRDNDLYGGLQVEDFLVSPLP